MQRGLKAPRAGAPKRNPSPVRFVTQGARRPGVHLQAAGEAPFARGAYLRRLPFSRSLMASAAGYVRLRTDQWKEGVDTE